MGAFFTLNRKDNMLTHDLRTDYARTGVRSGNTNHPVFPVSRLNPVIVFATDAGGRIHVERKCTTAVQIRNAIESLESTQGMSNFRAIGCWPGKNDTDFFELNLEFYKNGAQLTPVNQGVVTQIHRSI